MYALLDLWVWIAHAIRTPYSSLFATLFPRLHFVQLSFICLLSSSLAIIYVLNYIILLVSANQSSNLAGMLKIEHDGFLTGTRRSTGLRGGMARASEHFASGCWPSRS